MPEKSIKKQRFFILAAVLLIAAAVVMGITYFTNPAGKKTGGGLQVEKDTVNWNGSLESDNKVEGKSVKVPYYSDIYMDPDTRQVRVTLVNPKENNCYFTYTWTIEGQEEAIYTSDLIEPGKAIEGIELAEGLESGEYKLDMQISTYSMKDQKEMNKAVVKTKLIVS